MSRPVNFGPRGDVYPLFVASPFPLSALSVVNLAIGRRAEAGGDWQVML